MECPVCKEEYPSRQIDQHVNQCIAEMYPEFPVPSVPKQKRQLPIEENSEVQQHKKLKSESVMDTSSVFGPKLSKKDSLPLAERMRPKSLEEYTGQRQVVGENMLLQQLLSKGHILSMIFWGPPGCGKSSLANVISCICKKAHAGKIHIVKLSAVSSGVNSIREAVEAAKNHAKTNRKTVVFMDEIHRFNKLQQDIFLPHVEAGTFVLIGTTTENPSYSLNSALLSRCRVFPLRKLTVSDINQILEKAVKLIQGQLIDSQEKNLIGDSAELLNSTPYFLMERSVIDWLAEVCDGDARVALNSLELAVKTNSSCRTNGEPAKLTLDDIKESLKQLHTLNDRESNTTHHVYSALHKSIQGGNANASLYWLARLMAIREDPVNIARRLVRISSEDVGLKDPHALGVAVHTMHGCQMIGMPECDVLLGQCAVYLANAPKSRLMYNALKAAEDTIINHKGPQPNVPIFIRDRSGKGKLQAVLGKNKNSVFAKEDDVKTYLPRGLAHLNFYQGVW